MEENDPFYSVKGDVESELESLLAFKERIIQILRSDGKKKKSLQGEFLWAKGEIGDIQKRIESYITELKRTIEIVEEDPEDYGEIVSDLPNRKDFVRNSENSLRNCLREVKEEEKLYHQKNKNNSHINNRKNSKQNTFIHDQNDLYRDMNEDEEDDNSDNGFFNETNQKLDLVERQKVTKLKKLNQKLDRIKEKGKDIDDELDEQLVRLGVLDHVVENTKNMLNRMTRKLEILSRGRGKMGVLLCIVILIIVLIVLILLLFI